MPSSPLPFLEDKRQSAGVVSEHMGASPGLKQAVHELMQALEAKDSGAAVAALRSAVELILNQEE